MKKIPSVQFESNYQEIKGVDIISLDKIAQIPLGNNATDPEKPHQLKFFMLIYYYQGSSQHFVDFDWYPVKQNTLVYLSKDQINAYAFKPNLKAICLLFTQEYFNDHFSHLSQELVIGLFTSKLFSPIIQIDDTSNLDRYFQLLHDEFNGTPSTEKEAIISALFTIILSKAHEFKTNQLFDNRDASKVRLISRFIEKVRADYVKNRNASYYAVELGITYKHLNVCCKEILQVTAKQYIDNYIVLEAKRRLINSDIKSTELAYQLGFDEPTNFTKFFKGKTKFTPNSFKNKFQ